MSTRDKSDFKQQDILQAVIIADSYNYRYAPLTNYRPRALLPLVNSTLLEFTLQCLHHSDSGVKEVIVYCSSHADQIKKYLENNHWSDGSMRMKIIPIVSEGCISVGDALRDLDSKGILKSDFVLVYGDLVSNVWLKSIVEKHKQRRQQSKGLAMTMVFTEGPPDHRARCADLDLKLSIDMKDERLLSFQRRPLRKEFEVSVAAFDTAERAAVHYNLLDSGIYICSPHLPPLFADNFDYQTMDDLVHGIMGSEDILGNTINVHVAKGMFALRASSPYMYPIVCDAVLKHYAYPFVPDSMILRPPNGRMRFDHEMCHLCHYTHKETVKFGLDVKLEMSVAIDKDSQIGSNTKIEESTIGVNCKIGENVVIKSSHIFNNVTIEDGATIEGAFLDDGVRIGKSAHVKKGCILARGVVIGPNVLVSEGTKLVAEAGEGLEPLENNNGTAYRFLVPTEDEEVEHFDGPLFQKDWEDEDDDEEDEEGEEMDVNGELDDDDVSDEKVFDELMCNFEHALIENVSMTNLILETNSIKHAYGITIHDLTAKLTKAVLELPFRKQPSHNMDAKSYLDASRGFLKKFLPLLKNYIKCSNSQETALRAFEEFAVNNVVFAAPLMKLVHWLYDNDVISEQAIMKWEQSKPGTSAEAYRTKMAELIEWLKNAEEESD